MARLNLYDENRQNEHRRKEEHLSLKVKGLRDR